MRELHPERRLPAVDIEEEIADNGVASAKKERTPLADLREASRRSLSRLGVGKPRELGCSDPTRAQ
jgi:hypothetical protein